MARHGKSPDRPKKRYTAREVARLVRALYARPLCGAGCCLHSVTDDYNIGDASVKWTLDYAIRRGHAYCIDVAMALHEITTTQRRKALWLAKYYKGVL